MPDISIIIPVYNASKYVRETMLAVAEQSYTNWEMLLIDDKSTDNSVEIINKTIRELEENGMPKGKIRVFLETQNRGVYYARNIGVAEAKARYLCYLDADDLWKKDKLEKQITFMRKRDIAFSFISYEYADEYGAGKGKIAKVPAVLSYKQALKNTIIFTSTVMFDTEKIPKELIKMPNIKYSDTATWWGILQKGYQAYGIKEVLVLYRRSKGTLSSNKRKALKGTWNLYRKVAKLNVFQSAFYFCFWAVNATLRRL